MYMLLYKTKTDVADMIKLRILRWRDYSELSEWDLNVITSVFIREGRERFGSTEEEKTR